MTLRFDGLSNALTGIGGQQDRTRGNYYTHALIRPDDELTAIWTSNGLGKKVCTLQVDDMIRPWIEVPEDPEGKLVRELDRLGVREALQRMLYWTDLYRGAIGVLILKDGSEDLSLPLKESKTPAPLVKIQVYPVTKNILASSTSDIVTDSTSPYFGMLETYKIQPVDYSGMFTVHDSRCLVSKGCPMPEDSTIEWEYRYWGVSRLQAIFDDLTSYNASMNAFSNLIHQATISKMTIDGLAEIVADNDAASDNLKKLMDNIAKSISYLNMILMSNGDKFERDQLSLGGWREVSQMFRENLAATAGYSTSVLFETASSSGLAASSAEDQATKRYNNSVDVRRETDLRPLLTKVISHVAPMVGLPSDIGFKFRNLQEPTAKEVADIRRTHADTAKVYVDMGALYPEEVRTRFEGDTYSDEIVLNPAYAAKTPEEIQAEKDLEAATKAAQGSKAPVKLPQPPKKAK